MKHFYLTHQSTTCRARVGRLKTMHGVLETPVFMPVATQAVFKGGVDSRDAQVINASIILANTYHLYLRGAVPVIKRAGGLHSFMKWNRPILTDSGGFQVWSLGLGAQDHNKQKNLESTQDLRTIPPALVKINDDGVTFKSHLDGSQHHLTPERAIQIQQALGADIIMTFDEATPDNASYDYTKQAMQRTHDWAEKCLVAASSKLTPPNRRANRRAKPQLIINKFHRQLLFGIVQGGRFKRLRIESAKFIAALPFDGVAIGGESVGYNMKRTAEILDYLALYLPVDKPLYTMGVGSDPRDFFTVVEKGVDMFDCVAPARLARHGTLYSRQAGRTNNFRINIFNAKYKQDFRPICNWCDCLVCQGYSRAYLRHLFKAEELTALRLGTMHNLRFMLKVMEEIRQAIKQERFLELKKSWQSF